MRDDAVGKRCTYQRVMLRREAMGGVGVEAVGLPAGLSGPPGLSRGSPEGKGGCVPGGSIAGRPCPYGSASRRDSRSPRQHPRFAPPRRPWLRSLAGGLRGGRRVPGGVPKWGNGGRREGDGGAWSAIRQRNWCGSAANTGWGMSPHPRESKAYLNALTVTPSPRRVRLGRRSEARPRVPANVPLWMLQPLARPSPASRPSSTSSVASVTGSPACHVWSEP